MITHRCKELLEYNKKSHIPVAIRYEKWFNWLLPTTGDYPSWILSCLEWVDDCDNKYMSNCCRIVYCPFCGEKLND